jgi:hypothetical protein
MDHERRRVARARAPDRVAVRVDDRIEQSDHAARLAVENEAVHPFQHDRGAKPLSGVGAQRAPQVGHPQRRLDSPSRDVSDRDPDLVPAERNDVVPVAPDVRFGAAGTVTGRETNSGHGWQVRQKASLNRLGDLPLDLDLVRRALQGVERHADDRVAFRLARIPAQLAASGRWGRD